MSFRSLNCPGSTGQKQTITDIFQGWRMPQALEDLGLE